MNSRPSANSTRILKVSPTEHSEERELAFELDFLASLTVEQRFQLQFQRSREMAALLSAHGHAEASSIVKRT
jgi:hypothetical protein